MLGTRMLAGCASGTGRFGKLCLGSSGVPSVRTIMTSDNIRLPGIGTTTVAICDITHLPDIWTTTVGTTEARLPSIRTTGVQAPMWFRDFIVSQRLTVSTCCSILTNL
nr:unnamed protein product [Callosobruchus analis]